MNKHLSIPSRILVAIASVALIAVFFVPVWRIDLFAPQYPEGLTMKIWINTLSGQVDIINGLNHYIGMKHIKAEMFPEFTYLPFVVGFFILLGLITAVTGSRKLLFGYLILSVIGGALAIYDFYQWGYDYGHNLDPTAPIQVPGLSYQPPLIGHKKLLNFDAYSMPDIGGWIVIAASAIAFSVWFFAWYKQRKSITKPLAAAAAIALCFNIQSCSVAPEPISYGKDVCTTCKMGFVDPKFGGELISKKGKVFKFDDVICMVRFMRSGTIPKKDIAQQLVINYKKQNEFITAGKAVFVVNTNFKTPMNSSVAAFFSKEDAEALSNGQASQLMSWDEVYNKLPE